ncbi:MAG TPA: DUF433 domain-containing protein [Acidimicrobiales bacterium]|nr:DUF433 domain-containing protein [Acidimicrobiales bacterium]
MAVATRHSRRRHSNDDTPANRCTGSRLDVATVVADIAAGESFDAVQEAYSLPRQQVGAALSYAAHLAAHMPPAVSEAS